MLRMRMQVDASERRLNYEKGRTMRNINVELEMKALDVEMIAMQEVNIERDQQGHTHAYGSEAFFELAKRYRKLKAEGGGNG